MTRREGGISTPAWAPLIFLFTGDSGEQCGYRDGCCKDNICRQTGKGETGGMEFRGGKKAIRGHLAKGKALLPFESLGTGAALVHSMRRPR